MLHSVSSDLLPENYDSQILISITGCMSFLNKVIGWNKALLLTVTAKTTEIFT